MHIVNDKVSLLERSVLGHGLEKECRVENGEAGASDGNHTVMIY